MGNKQKVAESKIKQLLDYLYAVEENRPNVSQRAAIEQRILAEFTDPAKVDSLLTTEGLSDLIVALKSEGVFLPLSLTLILKNLSALDKLAVKAGFDNFKTAIDHRPEARDDDMASESLPVLRQAEQREARDIHETALEFLELKADDRLVDFGAHIGQFLNLVASRHPEVSDRRGVDMSEELVALMVSEGINAHTIDIGVASSLDHLEEILTSYDTNIIWAQNTNEGFLRMKVQKFNILITDGWMPNEGDGIRLANIARVMYPRMPIIMLTSEPPAGGIKSIDVVVKKSPNFLKLNTEVFKLLNLN